MQGRKCSFATEQTFVNQSTHRQFVFTSEHTWGVQVEICLKIQHGRSAAQLKATENKNSYNDTTKIIMYKWNKSPLIFECLKIQIICIIDSLFKLYSIITEADRDNAWEGKYDNNTLFLSCSMLQWVKKTPTNQTNPIKIPKPENIK